MNRQSAAKALRNIKLYEQSSTTSHNDVLFRINNPIKEMERYKQFIYILTEPNSLNVRYVGRTSSPNSRLSGHMYDSERLGCGSHKRNWLLKLKRDNKIPDFHIIDYIEEDSIEIIDKMESYYVLEFSKLFKLTNFYKIHKDETYFKRTLDIGAKPVFLYDLKGNFLKEYTTTKECSIDLNFPYDRIVSAIHTKQMLKRKYYVFREACFNPYKGPGKGSHMFKTVYEFNEKSEIINQFNSCKAAADYHNLKSSSINGAIIQNTKLKGKIFSHDKEYKYILKKKGLSNSIKIKMFDLDGNFIKSYNSMSECQTDLNYKGNISLLIKNGGRSTKLKYKFEFM
jgi:hypothetical protein